MAAGYPQADVLSRVRREQRSRGSRPGLSGLRIVLAATAITVVILLFAFGAIGMLLMARAPQEPIASRLDQAPALPLIEHVQEEVPIIPPAEKKQIAAEPKEDEPKAVKTLRFVAPAPAPDAQKKEETAQHEQPREHETTGSVPPPQAQQKQQPPQRAVQRQQQTRRQTPDDQSDNPLFRLFGIKQYR